MLLPRWVFAAVIWMTAATTFAASPLKGLQVENFRVAPERHRTPYERQNKFLIEAARGQPVEDGRFLLTKARLRAFKVTGEVEMEVATASCVYDLTNEIMTSSSPVSLQTLDGQFAIAGIGFYWEKSKNKSNTNSVLVISNSVRTLISSELLQTSGSKSSTRDSGTGPLEIRADRFQYHAGTGLGEYSDNVSVTGTNLDLRAGLLTLLVPGIDKLPQFSDGAEDSSTQGRRGSNPRLDVRRLEAERGVTLRRGAIRARGEKAIYETEGDTLVVTGRPTWEMEERSGRADVVRIYRDDKIFISEGNAFLRLPFEGREFPGFAQLAGDTQTQSFPTNQIVEITCDRYVIGSNTAAFTKDVLVREVSQTEQGAKMSCQHLTLGFAGTNELKSFMAEHDVEILHQDRRFTAGRLDYDAESGLARFNNNPTWQVGTSQGSGKVILVHLLDQEMEVRGDATLKFPAEDFAPAWSGAGLTNKPAPGGPTLAEITSRQYRLSKSLAEFEGNVHLQHPRMDWACDRMTMRTGSQSNAVEKVVAEPNVRFVLTDKDGNRIHGAGDQAVYTRQVVGAQTNSIVELTGSPASLRSGNGVDVKNRILLLDLQNNKFVVPPGGYRITGPTNLVGTNLFRGFNGSVR